MSEHYHFIGIGGIGMSGLARILLERGMSVSGSDIAMSYTVEGLMKMGAKIYKGHSADIIAPHMKVVYSSDISPSNPEYQEAIKLGCSLWHRSDLLAHLIEGSQSFAVAGTHGKTTTTALLAAVFMEAGLDPSFAVGGMLPQFQSNARSGKGRVFILEADESDRTFLKYFPTGAIVTNIDGDHLNAYEGSQSKLIHAFEQFMSQVSSSEHLFWCGDDPLLTQFSHAGYSYGFSSHCHWRIESFRQEGFRIWIDIKGGGQTYSEVEVVLTGRHNALNALAVFGLARTIGIPESMIRQALRSFKGVMRRCEKKGEVQGVLFLDDYAHHPTEIEVTLTAIRQAIGSRRLIAVFQPHRYSRTKDCLGLYGPIFDQADHVILTDIFAAGETPIPGLSHENILDELKQKSHSSIRYVPRKEISHYLAQMIQPQDVVVTLGAGDITKLGPEVIEILAAVDAKKP